MEARLYQVVETNIDPRLECKVISAPQSMTYKVALRRAAVLQKQGAWVSIYATSGECVAEFPNATCGD